MVLLALLSLQSIVCPDDCALDAWNQIEDNFHNNKTSRILHPKSQFNKLSLSSFPNVKAYYDEHQNLAFTLNNLSTDITDNRLALQVLHGLTSDYHTFRLLVQHMTSVPSLDALCSMLELEEHSINKDVSPSHESALITTPKPSPSENYENFVARDTHNHRGGQQSRDNHHSSHHHFGQISRSRRGPYSNQPNRPAPQSVPTSFNQWNQAPWPYWASPFWALPPCPFPTSN